MIKTIWYRVFGKQLVFYNPHRNTTPLLSSENRKNFIFVNFSWLVKITKMFGRSSSLPRKLAIKAVLSLFRPLYIIEPSWISPIHKVLHEWCNSHSPSKFIVVQHGLYIGGVVVGDAPKFARCNIMLCWGDVSLREFLRHNPNSKTHFVKWGNTVYNRLERREFEYKEVLGRKILFCPSFVTEDRIPNYEALIKHLIRIGFDVSIKQHNFQTKRARSLLGARILNTELFHLFRSQAYDLVISDHSTALIDAIFFKNNVLLFSPPGPSPAYDENAYTRRLINIHGEFHFWQTVRDVIAYVDISAQEKLLEEMVHKGSNDLMMLQNV